MPILARIALLLTINFLAASTHAQQENKILFVSDAWIRELPPNAVALAGYIKIDNSDEREHTLTGASSPAFEWIEIHRTVHEGTVVRMIPHDSLAISPGGRLILKPGGYHFMLMNPTRELQAGDVVQITLAFEKGVQLTVPFRVEKSRTGQKD